MSNLVLDESSMNREASRGYSWWFSGDAFERQAAQDRRPPRRNLSVKLWSHPGRLTILYFFALIALATVLLELPISAHNRMVTDPVVAFFTAVSAASTYGIQVVNTTTHWSLFGQAVILLVVQFGGLGVMTFASLIALAVNKHIKASQRMLTATELGATKLSETKGVLNAVLVTTLLIEVITFLALFPGLLHVNHGDVRHALWEALFFAVISYNNAGFTPDGAGLHVNSWGCRSSGAAQRVLRHARLPGAAQPHARRAQTHAAETLDSAHQNHADRYLLHGGGLAAMVPVRRVEQPHPVLARRPANAAAIHAHRGGHAAHLRVRPLVGAGCERSDESIHERVHVHRRRQHLHRRRHPCDDLRRGIARMPGGVPRQARCYRFPQAHQRAHNDDRGEHHDHMSNTGVHGVAGIDGGVRLLVEQRSVRYLLGLRTGRIHGRRRRPERPGGVTVARHDDDHREDRADDHRVCDQPAVRGSGGALPRRADYRGLNTRAGILSGSVAQPWKATAGE